MAPLDQAVIATRAGLRRQRPARYRWWAHAGALALESGAVIATCVYQLRGVRPWQWLAFGGALVLANFGEYWLHRLPFHHRRLGGFTYRRHTIVHHGFFTDDDMAVGELDDLRWVLFEPWLIPLLVLLQAPFFLALRLWAAPNLAWLFLLAVITYYSSYEIVHALAHLPANSRLGGSALVRRLTLHHRIHHDPRLMRRFNFNFAIPLFDWLFGTTYAKPE